MSVNLKPDINYFAELSKQPRPYDIVPFPRKVNGQEFHVALAMLTAFENAQVKADAEVKVQQYLKEHAHKNTKGYDELFNDFCAMGILWNSVRMENDVNTKFFPTKDSILEVLSVDEIALLLNHYYSLQLHKGPIIAEFSEEDLKTWMERIIRDGNNTNFLLNSLSVEALKQLINGLVSQLKTIPMEKSSAGSQ
jgi:hypothetical protein